MSADLRHMREAGPIGDSAAGVAGKVRSAEELEAADETAEELGSPAKTALSSDYGPGASAINPGVDSAGEIDYSKATVQPGGLPNGHSVGAPPPRGGTLQESDSAPGAQGYGGQQGGSADAAVLAESFEAQEAREPEVLSKQVQKASGSGGDGAASSEKGAAGAKKTSEGKTSLVPDEDLVGSKRSKLPPEESKPDGSGDLNDAVGPTHQSL